MQLNLDDTGGAKGRIFPKEISRKIVRRDKRTGE